jgi:hypothetical protein
MDNQNSLSLNLSGLTAGSITIDESFLANCNFIEVDMGTIEAGWIDPTNSFNGTSGTVWVLDTEVSNYEFNFGLTGRVFQR